MKFYIEYGQDVVRTATPTINPIAVKVCTVYGGGIHKAYEACHFIKSHLIL